MDAFSLDMDEGILALTFNEAMSDATGDIDWTGVSLRTHVNGLEGVGVTLWNTDGEPGWGTAASIDEGLTLAVDLHPIDLDDVKASYIGHNSSFTWLTLGAGAFVALDGGSGNEPVYGTQVMGHKGASVSELVEDTIRCVDSISEYHSEWMLIVRSCVTVESMSRLFQPRTKSFGPTPSPPVVNISVCSFKHACDARPQPTKTNSPTLDRFTLGSAGRELVLFFSEGVDYLSAMKPSALSLSLVYSDSDAGLSTTSSASLLCSSAELGRRQGSSRSASRREIVLRLDEPCDAVDAVNSSSSATSAGTAGDLTGEDGTNVTVFVGGYPSDWSKLVAEGALLDDDDGGLSLRRATERVSLFLDATSEFVADFAALPNPLVAVEDLTESFPGKREMRNGGRNQPPCKACLTQINTDLACLCILACKTVTNNHNACGSTACMGAVRFNSEFQALQLKATEGHRGMVAVGFACLTSVTYCRRPQENPAERSLVDMSTPSGVDWSPTTLSQLPQLYILLYFSPVYCSSASIPINRPPLLFCFGVSQTVNHAATGRTDPSPARTCTTPCARRARSGAKEGTSSSCPLAPQKPTLTAIVSAIATPPEQQQEGMRSWRVRPLTGRRS